MLKAVCQNTLPFHSHRDITARFDGGSLTSAAGWLLFGSLDRQHRLCQGCTSSARMGHFGFQVKRQSEPMLIGLV